MNEKEQREKVVEVARSWLRTPYHHMGRIKGVGVDCAMLPAEVYREAGCVPHIEQEFYPMDWHLHQSAERYLNKVLEYATETTDPKPGDFVIYQVGRTFAHGAIIVDWPLVIESRHPKGVQLCDMNVDQQFADRKHKFFTLWGAK